MLKVEKTQGLNVLKNYDWFLVFLIFALNAYGLIVITSVSRQLGTRGISSNRRLELLLVVLQWLF